jgi:hypothetical protein
MTHKKKRLVEVAFLITFDVLVNNNSNNNTQEELKMLNVDTD